VLQIKELAVNASFLPTDPASYLLVIDQMIKRGFSIIFAGREKCPKIFKDRGVLNYSESDLASPENDYFLVREASAVLSSASGFAVMADVMGKPLLTVNSWSFKFVPNQTSLTIPSLLSKNNQRLKFKEQLRLATNLGHCSTALNRDTLYSCQDASADDIYDAWQVILARVETAAIERETELQVRFRESFSANDPIRYACSRMSDAFLKKNLDLLG
jgi:putative glycosyltransferase (TIGR04372 family)